jgi:hypothetical protein
MPLTLAQRQELEAILPYGTPIQQKKIQAYLDHGSHTAAAASLGINRGNIEQAVKSCRHAAQLRGYSPAHDMVHTVPDAFEVRGVSTLYNSDGAVAAQWVKSRLRDEDKLEQMRLFAAQLAEEVKGKAKPVKAPQADARDRFCIYPMGDPHLGMYAWGDEAGEDFDLSIASRDLRAATERLTASCPATEVGIILNLGDFFHADDSTSTTKRSGHRLDTDTRWRKVMGVGAETMKACIEAALTKHQRVIVKNNLGNHDDHTSQALALILDAYYSREPRVEIDTSPNPYWYYRFGKVLIASTHGHSVKPEQLLSIMAHDRARDWGETQHRYWYLGHFHTKRVHEVGGLLIEYFRTLAAKDQWTNESGYRSGRDMSAIVHHAEWGEIERHRADILMVRGQ